jgi:RHS repeat-associated protein
VLAQTREFGKLSYQYDPSNELTSVSAQGTEKGFFGKFEDKVVARDLSQTYGYDLAGNRTLASISGASQFVDNQIVSNAHSTFQSDADGFGNLSSEILNDSAHFTRNYTYRTDGKLTQMDVVFDREWRCDPSVTQVVTQTQYSYDALGRRAAKLTTFKPNLGHGMGPAMGYTQSFSYLVNQDKILLAKSGDGITTLYLDGQGIDEHLGKVSKRGTQPYFTDYLGSVLNTAIAGGLQSYDSYGRTIAGFPLFAEVLSSDPVNYGFAGRQFDIESEKYYNRARMYDPSTGRFLNQDPIGLRGGSNLYRYVGNDPLSFIDPYGLCTLSVGLTANAGVVASGGGSFFLNFGYSDQSGFSFSITGATEYGLSGTPGASILGSLFFTDAADVSGLLGGSYNYSLLPAVGIVQGGGFYTQSLNSDVSGFGLNLGVTTPTFGIPISTSTQNTFPIYSSGSSSGEVYGPPSPSEGDGE